MGKNIDMNKKPEDQSVKIHVMPPSITDEDITALFNGIVNVVKKKFELEKNAETINVNLDRERLIKELKEKNAEISRLKNEIIYLKAKLNQE